MATRDAMLNITRPEQLMGLRPAPNYLANPEGYERLQHALNEQAQRRKAALDRRERRRYGGGDEE
jgi:hypothetical protein